MKEQHPSEMMVDPHGGPPSPIIASTPDKVWRVSWPGAEEAYHTYYWNEARARDDADGQRGRHPQITVELVDRPAGVRVAL